MISYLTGINGADSAPLEEAVDVFVGGERIVCSRNTTVMTGTTFTISNECTLVFDVHDGLISRLAMHYELSKSLEPRPPIPSVGKGNGKRCLAPRDRA